MPYKILYRTECLINYFYRKYYTVSVLSTRIVQTIISYLLATIIIVLLLLIGAFKKMIASIVRKK